ncbi:hypothetical protein B0T10DRAFT_493739 [Thelonectria olida]|uniref:DUF1772-domain-containing protein n=1 Tax=Thelonectria olida TaxID=1576542 RepID=A0A9P9AM27_9HYPO|nr:hypothetical protein B0T10DRAFT_493739 [Thelonectria olida]
MDHPLYRPLLGVSITASSFLVGCQFSLSHVSLATITGPPHVPENTLLTQFRTVFNRGFHLCPSSAFFSSFVCFANAALTYRHSPNVELTLQGLPGRVPRLLLAGSLMVGIVPYTLALIVPVEEVLLKREAKIAKARKDGSAPTEGSTMDDTMALLRRWNVLNYGRTMLPLLGAIVAWTLY